MVGVEYYKRYISHIINLNPTVITINRSVEITNGYGGSTKSKLDPFDVKVLVYKKRSNKEIIDTSGKTLGNQVLNTWKILSEGDADIERGDVFSIDGIEFKASFVNNYYDICKQIELEAIAYV